MWRLYLVGGSMAFRDGRMGVDQILAGPPRRGHTRCRRCAPGEQPLPWHPCWPDGSPRSVDGGHGGWSARRRRPGRASSTSPGGWRSSPSPSPRAVVAPRRRWPLVAARRPRHRLGRPARLAHPTPLARPRRGPALRALLGGPLASAPVARPQGVPRPGRRGVRRVAAAHGRAARTTSAGVARRAVGVVVWLVGLVFEAVGDAQLAAYKAPPRRPSRRSWTAGCGATRGTPTTSATRASGGASGSPARSASGWLPGLLTVVRAGRDDLLPRFATGARLLERTMMQRPGYPEYAARTLDVRPAAPRADGRGAGSGVPPRGAVGTTTVPGGHRASGRTWPRCRASRPLDPHVARMLSGDEATPRTVYRQVHPPLLRYLTVLVGPDDAEDVASEAWAQAFRDLDRFAGGGDGFRGVAHHHRSQPRAGPPAPTPAPARAGRRAGRPAGPALRRRRRVHRRVGAGHRGGRGAGGRPAGRPGRGDRAADRAGLRRPRGGADPGQAPGGGAQRHPPGRALSRRLDQTADENFSRTRDTSRSLDAEGPR